MRRELAEYVAHVAGGGRHVRRTSQEFVAADVGAGHHHHRQHEPEEEEEALLVRRAALVILFDVLFRELAARAAAASEEEYVVREQQEERDSDDGDAARREALEVLFVIHVEVVVPREARKAVQGLHGAGDRVWCRRGSRHVEAERGIVVSTRLRWFPQILA